MLLTHYGVQKPKDLVNVLIRQWSWHVTKCIADLSVSTANSK